MAKKIIKQAEKEKRHNMIYNIPKEIAPEFIRDSMSLRCITSIESLDCKESFVRKKRDDLSIQDVLKIIYESNFSFFSFILRKYHAERPLPSNYWEFCASGMKDSVEYFFWIEVEEESGYKLVEKYKLKKNDDA